MQFNIHNLLIKFNPKSSLVSVNLGMNNPATGNVHITRMHQNERLEADDILAAEEPLEIRINYPADGGRVSKSLSITMRTPGADKELAVGFLFTEGIISSYGDIDKCIIIPDNIVQVVLADHITPDLKKLERNFYTTSSCGVCGKSSIDAVRTVCNIQTTGNDVKVSSSILYSLPETLRAKQDVFEHTGGLHASALFTTEGELLMLREDVGRHNALDKLIGACLEKGMVPLDKYVLLLSGRASFELMQKAAMAGIKVIAAVGAPSTLAVQMAEDSDITLAGFLRGERFNIYTKPERII